MIGKIFIGAITMFSFSFCTPQKTFTYLNYKPHITNDGDIIFNVENPNGGHPYFYECKKDLYKIVYSIIKSERKITCFQTWERIGNLDD